MMSSGGWRRPREMARMAGVEPHAAAAGLAGAEARGADHDEDGRPGVGAQPVERLVARIVGRDVEACARHAEADHGGGGTQAAVELGDGVAARGAVDVQPVAQDDVGVRALCGEGVVVQRACLSIGCDMRTPRSSMTRTPVLRKCSAISTSLTYRGFDGIRAPAGPAPRGLNG